MQVGVLFAKNGILALNKPAGICSQGPKLPGTTELGEMVRRHHPEGHTAHRIDKFTSGVNLAGASRKHLSYLMRNWHQITRKKYLAIIGAPTWNTRTVSTPIDGKSAVTAFTVLERVGMYALIQCELVQNGRTHQIRRHLRSIGTPIVGDWKYNGPITNVRRGQLLHAWRMEVRLPDEFGNPGEWATIQAPIPEDFRRYGFDYRRWDISANATLETWKVPQN